MAERQDPLLAAPLSTSDEFSTATCSLISPRRIFADSDCHLLPYECGFKHTDSISSVASATPVLKQFEITTSATGHYKNACSPSEKMRKPHAKRPTPEWAREKRRKFAMEHYPLEENYMLPAIRNEFDKLSQYASSSCEATTVNETRSSMSSASFTSVKPVYRVMQEAEPVFDETRNILISNNDTEKGDYLSLKNVHLNKDDWRAIKALQSDSDASFVMMDSARSCSNESLASQYDVDEETVNRMKKVAAGFKERHKNNPKIFDDQRNQSSQNGSNAEMCEKVKKVALSYADRQAKVDKMLPEMERYLAHEQHFQHHKISEIEHSEKDLRQKVENAMNEVERELAMLKNRENTVVLLKFDLQNATSKVALNSESTAKLLKNHQMTEMLQRQLKELNDKYNGIVKSVGDNGALEEILPFYAEFASATTRLTGMLSLLRMAFVTSSEAKRLCDSVTEGLDFVRNEVLKHNSSTMTLDEVLELRARYGAESEMYGSAVQNTVAKRANGTDSSMSSWKSDVKQWSKSSISNAESSVCNFSFTETDKSMYISLHTTPENTLADNTSEIDRQDNAEFEYNRMIGGNVGKSDRSSRKGKSIGIGVSRESTEHGNGTPEASQADTYAADGESLIEWPVAEIQPKRADFELNIGYDRIVEKSTASGVHSIEHMEVQPWSTDSDSGRSGPVGSSAVGTNNSAIEKTCQDKSVSPTARSARQQFSLPEITCLTGESLENVALNGVKTANEAKSNDELVCMDCGSACDRLFPCLKASPLPEITCIGSDVNTAISSHDLNDLITATSDASTSELKCDRTQPSNSQTAVLH